jgi:hypothetical protein
LDLGGPDLVVIVSPHGRTSGVYQDVGGSFTEFGVTGFSLDHATDAAAASDLAAAWGKPLVHDRVDHGVLVPLALLAVGNVPVVAVALQDTTSDSTGLAPSRSAAVEAVAEDARGLAGAVEELCRERNVTFLASANTSAALNPRAPVTGLPGAQEMEERTFAALRHDVGELEDLAADLWRLGGSCAAGPLVALSRLFAGRPAAVLAYECPFGVGYPVAVARAGET